MIMFLELPCGTSGLVEMFAAPHDRQEQAAALQELARRDEIVGFVLPWQEDAPTHFLTMRGRWTVPCWTANNTVQVWAISKTGGTQLLAESRPVVRPRYDDVEALNN